MRRGVVSESLPGTSLPDLSNIEAALFRVPDPARLQVQQPSVHPPRIALLYGSLRARSFSRLLTIPNQSSVAKAFLEFDDHDRMKPSACYDRVVDVMEELVKLTLPTRDIAPQLVDRYSERNESAQELSKRVSQASI